MARVLYLTRTGLAEDLGQSQVMAYLRGLSAAHEIVLATCEKPADLADAARMAALRADCAAHGIDWRPLAFAPGRVGAARGLAGLAGTAGRLAARGGIDLIHARAYVPALAALWAHRRTGVPFVFDMRALWPEELIAAGRLRAGGPTDRALRRAERVLLARAAGTVSLTHAAARHLRRLYPEVLASKRVDVIPTCADLSRFRPAPMPEGPETWSCLGTVLSGWFRTDMLDALWAEVARRDPAARFEVVTRDDPARVRAALPGVPPGRLSVGPARPGDVPARLAGHHVSAFFYVGHGASDLGRAPTRLAEILGTGRPVVANPGVGDVAEIVAGRRVGVLMEAPTPEAAGAALDALDRLRADAALPALPARARETAEAVFSLEAGTAAYAALYDRILGGGAG